jgi:hypothetical protein
LDSDRFCEPKKRIRITGDKKKKYLRRAAQTHLFILVQEELDNPSGKLEIMCIEISWPEHNARECVEGDHPVGHQGIQLQFIVQGNLVEKNIKAMLEEKFGKIFI